MELLQELDDYHWQIQEVLNMRDVEIKRADVLARLKENRQKHEGDQEKAVATWAAKIKERLATILSQLTKGEIPDDVRELVKDLEKPTNVLQAYDDAIEMVEMDVRETLILQSEEFKCYMQDRWQWKRSWSASNSKYL